jgi:site-specific recombinase XerD
MRHAFLDIPPNGAFTRECVTITQKIVTIAVSRTQRPGAMNRPDKLPKVLTAEETDRLLSQPNHRYFSPHRDYLFMRLMLKAGLRASEAVSLKPQHIQATEKGAVLVVRDGKGAKDRKVGLPDDLYAELEEWAQERRPESEYLLPTSKGTKVDPSQLRRSVKRYARDAEIGEVERVSPHTLRHTFATRYYEKYKDLRGLRDALGHSDISTTQIYTHVANGDVQDRMRRL